ncbi:MAG: helix-turn-helix transcriptional regulator [Candidatus Hodarchaeales archaeon]|jgi:predicted ArsR family transcriptional regulator
MSHSERKAFVGKRERILQFLLINRSSTGEGCSLKDIAQALNLSTTGLRHYLNMLENEGLLTHTEKQGKTGRPAMIYSLTETGLNVFPKAYTDFSVSLLNEIKSRLGEKVTIEILESIGKKNATKILRLMNNNLEEGRSFDSLQQKLKSIVEIFNEWGKFPELIEEESSFLLKNYNCLYHDIVKEEPLVCKVTETIISELVNDRSTKEKCIRDGCECCLFRIMKD